MNILVIDDSKEKFSNLYNAFEKDPVNAFFFAEPPAEEGEEYLAGLMRVVNSEAIEAIFSLSYYRFLSLACGVLRIPYVCWLINGYEESSYDVTIKNEWNHIYCADYDTYRTLSGCNLSHLEYLPVSHEVNIIPNETPSKDILFVSEDIQTLLSTSLKFDLLKDSSKGYIDGVLNSYKADLREKALYDNLAAYIRDDVRTNYPLEKEDLEPMGHKYDNTVFFPILDNKTQHIMLYHISAEWVKEDYKIDVLTRKKPSACIEDERITYYTREKLPNGGRNDFGDYKLVIFFPKYSERNMIAEEMLDIMASGSVLLLPGYVNDHILEELGGPFFRNRYELSKRIKKYLYDEEARNKIVRESQEHVGMIDSYGKKLKIIFDNCFERG